MGDRDLSTATRQVFGTVERGTECRICGRNVDDGRSVYCSDYCRNLAKAVMGMLNWSSVRRRIIERDGETCQMCGFNASWLDAGDRHIRAIVDSKLPERPVYPTLEEIGAGEVRDEKVKEYFDKTDEWTAKRDELTERYGDWRTRHHHLEVDHIQPISKGGHPFDPANLRTLCSDCHKEKTAEDMATRRNASATSRPEIEATLAEYVADGGDADGE